MGTINILRASAGSGKTFRLAYEFIYRVVHNPMDYSSILAVTFTNKATEGMKRRILEQLGALAQGQGDYLSAIMDQSSLSREAIIFNARQAQSLILHDYSRFSISTIDAFFQRIVRSFFRELGLDFSYQVELSGDTFLAEAIENLLARSHSDPALRNLVERAVDESVDGNHGWDIRKKLMTLAHETFNENYKRPSGNPEQLIHVHQKLVDYVESRQKLIEQKCGQALEIMSAAGLDPTDFKYGKSSFASYMARIYGRGVVTAYGVYYRSAIESPEQWALAKSPHRATIESIIAELWPLVRDVGQMVDEFLPLSNSVDLLNRNFSNYLLLGAISIELEKLWSAHNSLPIFRTTSLIEQLVEQNSTPFIYEKIGNRYSCYMIDEFQDTSRGQWSGFVPLLDDVLGHTSGVAALLIGDVKQAIYRWRGGDWDILAKGASLHFQGRSGDGEHLTTNWRSEPLVVEFNNHLIGSVVHECSLKIESFLESSPALVQELGGAIGLAFDNFEQQSAPIFEQGSGYVELCRTDEPLERILQTVADILSRGYTQRDIAILVRTKVQGAQVAQQLVNGGYNVISEQALEIGSCSTISLIVAFISVAMNREDMILGELLELRLGGHLTAEQLNVVDMIPLMSPLDAAVATVECLGLGHEDVSYIQGFYQAILDFCGRCVADTTLFLEWWHQSGQHTALELPSAQDAIKVDTIHRSKGLEYPCVVIPFADWSLLPATGSVLWSESMVSPFLVFNPIPLSFKKDIATSVYAESYLREVVYSHIDNVNLLYVALTRARGELYLNIPTEPRVNTIAELIDQALDEGNFEESVFTFGSKKIVHGAAATTPQEGLIFDSFEQHEFGPRVSVSWRYDLEGLSHELSPREKGVLQHGFFAQIALATDVRPLLDRMLLSGDIDDAQGDMLADSFNSLLGNPLATEWFNGTWELFSERSIITSDNQTYRPDRVMIHGHSAIVVDYKFGLVRTKSHLDQVQQYMQLLSAMGYVDVRGYLWYAAWQDVVSC